MEESRRMPRYRVECPVSFAVEDIEGTGTVYNLSEQGCAIASAMPVPDDGYAFVSITLPDRSEPVHIELARVRWVSRNEFGLEFRIVSRAARSRLQQFLLADKAA